MSPHVNFSFIFYYAYIFNMFPLHELLKIYSVGADTFKIFIELIV